MVFAECIVPHPDVCEGRGTVFHLRYAVGEGLIQPLRGCTGHDG
jgi:hypothetical protein